MWKKFKLLILGVLCCWLFDSCRLVSNVGQKVFHSTESQFTNREIKRLLKAAQNYQGVVYRYGGTNEKGFDCSGLLFRVYSDHNYMIPRSTIQQAEYGLTVEMEDIEKGDWLFFKTNGSPKISHVGLVTKVLGPQEVIFIHASTSKGVREDNLYSNYWIKAFSKVVRPYKNNSK